MNIRIGHYSPDWSVIYSFPTQEAPIYFFHSWCFVVNRRSFLWEIDKNENV